MTLYNTLGYVCYSTYCHFHDSTLQGKLLYCHPPPGMDATLFNDQLAGRLSVVSPASGLKQGIDDSGKTDMVTLLTLCACAAGVIQ